MSDLPTRINVYLKTAVEVDGPVHGNSWDLTRSTPDVLAMTTPSGQVALIPRDNIAVIIMDESVAAVWITAGHPVDRL